MLIALLLAAESLRIAVPAPLGPAQAQKDAEAVAALLSESLQRPVSGVVEGDRVASQLASGAADLAWLSAAEYVEAAKHGKVIPVAKLVRSGMPFYRSALFVKKDAGIKTIQELKGKRLAFVSKQSSAGYVLAVRILKDAGFTESDLSKARFLGDHASVCRAVLEGEADAGATFANDGRGGPLAGCNEALGAEKAAALKALATSDPIPNDVIAAKPGAPKELVEQLREALVNLSKSEAGQQRLSAIFHADAFVAAEDHDFAPLREQSR